ncbi:MAG: hypothetical protein RL347_235 [Actinomycetota bacterium]
MDMTEGTILLLRQAKLGVSDGTRTRDVLDHNQVLYQLSYTHRDPSRGRRESLAVGHADVRGRWPGWS